MLTTGIELNILGEENLTAQRPAVFIFNHRNQADPMIAGRLVEVDFTGVGKKGARKQPADGTTGQGDGRGVHRSRRSGEGRRRPAQDRRACPQRLVDPDRPEGTRLDTTEVGPFKKGPFRIAMAAGIPIVPIVIRNAEVIAAPRFQHVQPRQGGYRGVPADLG